MNSTTILQFALDNLTDVEDKGSQIYAVCPFCGKQGHFNISKENGKFNCFRCGKKGHFHYLVKYILGWNTDVNKVVNEYTAGITLSTLLQLYDKNVSVADMFFNWRETVGAIELNGKSLACKKAVEYLASRNISLEYALELGIMVGTEGKYNHTVVIPIYFENEVVNYSARRIPPAVGKRYETPRNTEVNYKKSELLYNFDSAKESDWVVIVEGQFDCIALMQEELPAVALMGKTMSTDQLLLVIENWDEVIIMLDGSFLEEAIAIGKSLVGLTSEVRIAIIEGASDPSSNVELAIEALGKARNIECF